MLHASKATINATAATSAVTKRQSSACYLSLYSAADINSDNKTLGSCQPTYTQNKHHLANLATKQGDSEPVSTLHYKSAGNNVKGGCVQVDAACMHFTLSHMRQAASRAMCTHKLMLALVQMQMTETHATTAP
jgi:hypothetical protein